jgi:hypothetical protein
MSGLAVVIYRTGGCGGGGGGVVGFRTCCCLKVIVFAMLLQLFYYCVKDLIGSFYVFFVEMVVVCDFFMDIKSLYCVEVGSFFLKM